MTDGSRGYSPYRRGVRRLIGLIGLIGSIGSVRRLIGGLWLIRRFDSLRGPRQLLPLAGVFFLGDH
jgi:hypothetical protein